MEPLHTPSLSSSIRRKRFHQAKLLLELQCVDVNSKDNEGKTALMETCLLQDEAKAAKMAKVLLKNGAKIGLLDKKGRNAFMYACEGAREKLVKLLIGEALNFDINAVDYHGNTALHYASLTGNLDILKMLVSTLKRFKMSVDKTNKRGETPLICASKRGHILCVQYLVEEGKAATKIRDAVELKTAEEWQCRAQNDTLTVSYPVAERSYPGSAKKSSVNKCRDIRRPHTSLERSQNRSSLMKNYRNDLQFLFQIYEKQVSSGFLPGVVKPMHVVKEDVAEDLSQTGGNAKQDDLPLTLGPNGCHKTRLTGRKHAKIIIDTKDLCKRRLNAVPEIENPGIDSKQSSNLPFSIKRSQTIAIASRFTSIKSMKDRKVCQSAKATGQVGFDIKKCRNNFKNICLQEQKEVIGKELEDDRKIDNDSQKSEATHKNKNLKILTEEEVFLGNNNDCDDDDDGDHNLMSLSSPAALL